jgi:ABC-type transport system substrate-binding protein
MLRGGAAFSVGATALALIGCGSDDSDGGGGDSAPDAGPTRTSTGDPKQGGRFGETFLNSPNFNPVVNWQEGQSLSGRHVYDRILTSRADSRRYVLEAMEKVETPDPLTMIFTLKPNMKYQDKAPVNGRAVKADDIVAGEMYSRDVPNAYDNSFQKLFMDTVTAPDDRTLTFKLTAPNHYIFGSQMLGLNTNHHVIPKEILAGDLNTTPPVGSGPWSLAEYTVDARYLYKRYEGWREANGKKPYIDEQELIKNIDPVAQESMFRASQTHIFNPTPANADALAKDLDNFATLYSVAGLAQTAFWLNMERDYPWQKDERIRKAFWRMMNRQQIIDLVYRGKAIAPNGLIPAGVNEEYQLSAAETAEFQKFDAAEAKQLLQAANWDFNSEWEITQRQAALNAQLAEVFQQQASQVGVKTRVTQTQFQEWLPNLMGQRRYQIVLEPSPADETPGRPIRFQHSTTNNQNSGFGLHDPAIDALIEKSESTLDHAENVKLVKQIQLEAMKKYSSSRMIVTPQYLLLVNKKLQDYEVAALGNIMYRTEAWFNA